MSIYKASRINIYHKPLTSSQNDLSIRHILRYGEFLWVIIHEILNKQTVLVTLKLKNTNAYLQPIET